MRNLSDSIYIPWLMMTVSGPMIVVSASIPLLTTVASALFCMIAWWKPETKQGSVLSLIRWAAAVLLLASVLKMPVMFWQGRGAYYAVPAVLLILAVCVCIRGEAAAVRSANILRYGFWAVAVIFALSAVKDVRLSNLQQQKMIPSWMLGTVLLIPTLSEHRGKRKCSLWIFLIAVLASAVSQGVLGTGGDIRTLSRSISLGGALQRYESLIAAAMTVSFYSTAAFLLTVSAEEYFNAGLGKHKIGVIVSAILAACVYALPWGITDAALFAGILLTFTVIPAFLALIR